MHTPPFDIDHPDAQAERRELAALGVEEESMDFAMELFVTAQAVSDEPLIANRWTCLLNFTVGALNGLLKREIEHQLRQDIYRAFVERQTAQLH